MDLGVPAAAGPGRTLQQQRQRVLTAGLRISLNDACRTILLLQSAVALPAVAQNLQRIVDRAGSALVTGGVHTPNHRWELAALLARADASHPDPRLRDRISPWLNEGVDIDADGIYSERSANYAGHVSTPACWCWPTCCPVRDSPTWCTATCTR